MGICCCTTVTYQIQFNTYDCGGSAQPGTVVSVSGGTNFPSFTGTCTSATVGVNAYCLVTVPGLDTYSYTYTYSGATVSGTVTVTHSGTTSVSDCVGGKAKVYAKVTACTFNANTSDVVRGIGVKFSQGSWSTTATADNNGVAFACVPQIGVDVTATVPSAPSRYTSGTVTIPAATLTTACRTYGYPYGTGATVYYVTLSPATGYHCLPMACACEYPVKDSLKLTDTNRGVTTTLNYDTTQGLWVGTGTVSVPGCSVCSAVASYSITYSFPPEFTCNVTPGCNCALGLEGKRSLYGGSFPCSSNSGTADSAYAPNQTLAAVSYTAGAFESSCPPAFSFSFALCSGVNCGGPGHYCSTECSGYTGSNPSVCPQFTLTE